MPCAPTAHVDLPAGAATELASTAAATEAHYLLLAHAFHAGARRVAWSCNALNAASIRAARRLGYRAEGVLANDVVQAKHGRWRARDTAYLSILGREWPDISVVLQQWLAPENFDAAGRQLASLSALTAALPRLRREAEPRGWPWEADPPRI